MKKLMFALLLGILLIGSANATLNFPSDYVLSGIKHYWDMSGNGNVSYNLVNSSANAWLFSGGTSQKAERISYGLIGEGTNLSSKDSTISYINTTAYIPLNNWTISLWVNFSAIEDISTQYLLSAGDCVALGCGLDVFTNIGTLGFGVINGSGNANKLESDGTLTTNYQWYHLVLTYNGTTIQSYVDGLANSSKTFTLGSLTFTKPIRFGWSNDGSGNGLSGIMDEIGIWDRELNSSDVMKLYNNGKGFAFLPIENSQSYQTTALTGTPQQFDINITYDSTIYSSLANLVYNNTKYPATSIGTGNTITYSATAIAPIVKATTNISFYWEIGLSASPTTYFNSTVYNQTVYNITIDNCAANTVLLYNFTMRDEATTAMLNGTLNNTNFKIDLQLSSYGTTIPIVDYYAIYSKVNPISICINNNLSSDMYRVDITGEYSANGYVTEFYYEDNGTITNTTIPQQIGLYDLATADSTTFLFTFKDAAGLDVPNAIVHTFRKYIGENLFREVERSKDDNNGETHVHLVEEDVIYYFTITDSGRLLYTTDTYNAKCLSTPCTIEISALSEFIEYPTDYDVLKGFTITSNRTARSVRVDYVGDSALINMTTYMYRNGQSVLIANTSSTGSSVTLTSTIPVTYGNQTYFVALYKDNTFLRVIWIDFSESGVDWFGTTGAVLGGLMVMTVALMAVAEGIGLIVFICMALVIIMLMTLVDLGWLAVISIICAGGIIVWKLTTRKR